MEKTKILNARGFRMWKSGKQWMTSGAVAGVAVAMVAGSPVVSADEVSTTDATASTEVITPTADATATTGTTTEVVEEPVATSGVEVTESAIVNDTATGNAASNLADATAGTGVGQGAYDANAGTVTGESPVSIDHTELTNAAKDAEQVGVDVVQDPTSVAPTTSTAEDTKKAVDSISSAEHTKAEELKSVANSYNTAHSNWVDTKNSVTDFNTDLTNAHKSAVDAYNKFIADLGAEEAKVVAQYKDAIIKVTEELQTQADGTSVAGYQAYIKELANKKALNSQAISAYLVEKSKYESNSAEIVRINSLNTSNSARIVNENNTKSTSVVEHNNSLSLSASTVNANLSTSASTENARLSASASTENARLSASASTVEANNTAKSNSVDAYNKSQQASASAVNASLSASASAVNASNSAARTELDTANSTINAYNKTTMESVGLTYTGNYATDKAAVDAYNSSLTSKVTYSDADLRAWNAAVGGTSSTLPRDGSGYTPSNSQTFLPPVKLSNGVELVATGSLTPDNAMVLIRGANVDQSKVVTDVNWGSVNIEGDGLRTFVPGDGNDIWGNTYNYTTGGADKFFIVPTKSWYRIPNLITTLDGRVHDGYVMFDVDPSGLHPAYGGHHVAVWNANGAINALDGGRVDGQPNPQSDAVRTVISMDRPDNNDENIIWLSLMGDIDLGQYVSNDYAGILGVGGGLTITSSGDIASNEELGHSYGKDYNEINALNGLRSAPDGVALLVDTGTYTNVLRNTPGGQGWVVARADFGSEARVRNSIMRVVTPPTISLREPSTGTWTDVSYTPVTPDVANYTPDTTEVTNVDYTPVNFTPVTFTPVPFTPQPFTPEDVPDPVDDPQLNLVKLTAPATPKEKEIPKAPDVPTVHYKLTALNSNVKVTKGVQNEDGVDINNSSVAKGSTNFFILDPYTLNADRPITTEIKYSDYIQDGLELDIAGMTEENPTWDISFNEGTRMLTALGKAEELTKANADRKSTHDISSLKVIYTVLNDSATYTNTFRLDINGGVTGNVIVEYYNEETGEKISNNVIDSEEVPVGEPYDTTDNKFPRITKDGKTYELVPNHIEGDGETGVVTDKDKVVKYYYREVPPTPSQGSVIVHYVDEEGNPIKGDEEDTPNSPTGTPYDTTDNKPKRIKTNSGVEYELIPNRTRGNETGKVVEGVTEVTYIYKRVTPKPKPGNGITSYSNKVIIHTPGGKDNPNDPDNPNGGGNHKIQPVKNNTNEKGENINNKTLLQNDVNYYVAEWDLDQYINDKSSKSAIAKGFAYLDNPQDDALTGNVSEFKAVTGKGEEVTGLTFYELNSEDLSTVPTSVKSLLDNSGIDVTGFGTFYLWVADDAQAFYDTYVKTGTDIYFNLPMTVKTGFTGDYVNQTYQIDFGNGYIGNIVENDVPNLVPEKDVIVDGKSVDGQVIAYGQEFKYLLNGSVIPSNRGDNLWEYKYIDDYDQTGDKFLGTYQVVATTDITIVREITLEADAVYNLDVTLKDGSVIKAGETIPKGTKLTITEVIAKGSDLTDYTTMEHDEENGIITINFKEDFLLSVTNESAFGADATIDMKRIAYGEFENTYINRVNGVDYISNTVRTRTPKPEEPTPPTPPTPTPAEPVNPANVLPNTGEVSSLGMTAMGILPLLGALGIAGGRRRKK